MHVICPKFSTYEKPPSDFRLDLGLDLKLLFKDLRLDLELEGEDLVLDLRLALKDLNPSLVFIYVTNRTSICHFCFKFHIHVLVSVFYVVFTVCLIVVFCIVYFV